MHEALSITDSEYGARDLPRGAWLRAALTGDAAFFAAADSTRAVPLEKIPVAFVLAAANGQAAVVRELFHRIRPGDTATRAEALAAAGANGHLQVIIDLNERGIALDCGDWAAARAAAHAGQAEIAKFMFERGFPLERAAPLARRHVVTGQASELLTLLDSYGLVPGYIGAESVVRAIRRRDVAGLWTGFVNQNPVPDFGRELLTLAGEVGDPAILQAIMEKGASVQDHGGEALAAAAARGHLDAVRLLHQLGADITHDCSAALRLAAEGGHLSVVEYLVTNGVTAASLDAAALDQIAFNGCWAVYYYLTGCGADALQAHRGLLQAIAQEVSSGPPEYHPSRLWQTLGSVNVEQLRRGGLPSLKRTVAQNYATSLPSSLGDPMLLRFVARWLCRPSLRPFRVRLFDPDRADGKGDLAPFDVQVFKGRRGKSDDSLVGLRRALAKLRYRAMLALLWVEAERHDKLGLCRQLAEPRLGRPIEAFLGSRLVSQDLARSIVEVNTILGTVDKRAWRPRPVIAEIGAGYGRLAHVLMSTLDCRYVIFDVDPALAVSTWYLARLFPEKRVFHFRHFDRFEDIRAELEQADIAFFASNQIAHFPDGYFDLLVTVSTLHEMLPDRIRAVIAQISRTTNGDVYLKQYWRYENPYDGVTIEHEAYRLPEGWTTRVERTDALDPRFFELVATRVAPRLRREERAPAPRRTPTVAVVLANYNHGHYLRTALTGIAEQIRPFDEVIIVDDGSNDDSLEVIEAFRPRLPNLSVIAGRRRGQHAAAQIALQACRSEYFVWTASDDVLLPDFLARAVEQIEAHPRIGKVFSRLFTFMDGSSETLEYNERTQGAAFDLGTAPRLFTPADFRAELRRRYVWMSGNTVVARHGPVAEMNGIDAAARWHNDWLCYLALALRHGACGIPATLAMMRVRKDGYSAAGMRDPVQQDEVLGACLDLLHTPRYADLRPLFRRRPWLLSIFGDAILTATLRRPRHWDIAASQILWYSRNPYHRRFALIWLRRRLTGPITRPIKPHWQRLENWWRAYKKSRRGASP